MYVSQRHRLNGVLNNVLKDDLRPWGMPTTTLPDEMWNILQNRCPNLRELTIDLPLACRREFDPTPLLRCRWPNLHTLLVSDVWGLMDARHRIKYEHALPAFFAAHGDILSFGTVLCQFKAPLELPFLRHLQLTSSGLLTYSLDNLIRPLRTFASLTSLSLWLNFTSEWPCSRYVSDLLKACSQISHLEILTCLSNPTFVSGSVLKSPIPADVGHTRNISQRRCTT